MRDRLPVRQVVAIVVCVSALMVAGHVWLLALPGVLAWLPVAIVVAVLVYAVVYAVVLGVGMWAAKERYR